MIELRGSRVTLQDMTREAYHAVRQRHETDPLADVERESYNPDQADARFDAMIALEDWLFLGIFTEDKRIVGELAFKRIDMEKKRCELGISLAADADKGKGYGGEAFALATNYALHVLGMRAIFADTMGGNIRMQRILERLGYRCYLRLEECYDMGDHWEDRLDYIREKEGA